MADITYMKTPAETKLGEYFEAVRTAGDRSEAFTRFAEKGLPHRRIESWHYTDLRSLLREAYPPAHAPAASAIAAVKAALVNRKPVADARVVLVDGTYVAELSELSELPSGVSVTSLLDSLGQGPSATNALLAAEKLGSSESVLSLNAAFMQGGAVVTVEEGIEVEHPIEVLSFVTATMAASLATRSLVHLKAKAKATFIEQHISLGHASSQGNHVVVAALEDGAELDHVARIEGFPASAVHVGSVLARLGGQARLSSFTLTTAPGITRRQSFIEFAGEHSSISLRGVSLLSGQAHADTTLVVTHTAPHCESREYYKTILDGESTGVYQGKVVVAPGAQKTDGKMLSKAIFLADGASMYNKPELEIFADDVVCGHGATVGYLDEDQLFYLRARGIPIKEAQSLLLNAFAADAIEEIASDEMREELLGSVEAWLRSRQS